jgi:hypothetical protein
MMKGENSRLVQTRVVRAEALERPGMGFMCGCRPSPRPLAFHPHRIRI